MPSLDYHFIIVDDDADVRLFLRRLIGRRYETAKIFDAVNGQEALNLFETHGADLMIVDHHIPLLDGLSLIRFLRAKGVAIPLVLTSHNPQVEKLSAGAGATRFVDKSQLLESLEVLLPLWLEK
ncbi:MAG: response regulator receiver protein [Pedosphaera sp.]|nr:response regulator receiver protein [Pedosphaera sp.]